MNLHFDEKSVKTQNMSLNVTHTKIKNTLHGCLILALNNPIIDLCAIKYEVDHAV